MNWKQKIVLWIGIGFFVVMGTMPVRHFNSFDRCWESREAPISVVCLRWIMVSVVTGGIIITLKSKKKEIK